jgi:ABC-type dipeptide/oligopeptide/nickel transport system permease component
VLRFALRRILWTIPTLFLVVTLTFLLMRSIGGSPLRHGPFLGLSRVAWVKYGDWQPASIEANIKRKYGLDRPWYEQYGDYLKGVATLDLGPSLTFRDRTVNDVVRQQAPVTFELGALACLWALLVGVPLGVLCAVRAGSRFDSVVRVASGLGVAVPAFLVGTMLIYLVSVQAGLLPTSGWGQSWQQVVLPSLTLAIVPAAWIVRLLRGSMLDTLSADYVQAAAAKGLRRSRVVLVHALRNAALPVITAAAPLLGFLITGSFVVEEVFGIPGIGRYYIAAAGARDYPVLLGLTVVLTLVIVFANLVGDIAHAALDPRVRDARA